MASSSGLTGGGTAGNEQLTAMLGVVLLVLLAVLGVTIVRIGQLLWLHLFLGLLLIGPVAAKLASTGYRFVRYYAHNARYRLKGPPPLPLRAIAPMVVLSTVVVFITGVLLLLQGPSSRGRWLLVHKVSFIVWAVFCGLHVLGHLPGLGRGLQVGRLAAESEVGSGSSGEAGRWLASAGAVVGGAVLALLLVPDFAHWTAGAAHGAH